MKKIFTNLTKAVFSRLGRPSKVLAATNKDQMTNNDTKFKIIFEHAGGAVFIADAQTGILLDCNGRAAELIGCPKELLIGTHQSLLHPDGEAEKYKAKFSACAQKNTAIDFEGEIQRRDGRRVPVFISTQKFSLEGRELLLGLFIDVSTQKLIERQLMEERQRAQHYLEIVEVIILALDAKGYVTLINNRGCEILGYIRDEIVGKNWFDFFVPEDIRAEVKTVFLSLMEGRLEQGEHFVNRILAKNGKEQLIEWHNVFLKDHNGKLTGTLSSGMDVTQRELAEQKIKHAAEEWRRTFDSIADIVYILDENLTIVRANKACAQALNLNYSEIIGQKCYHLMHRRGEPVFNCPCARTKSYLSSYSAETTYHPQKPYLVTTSPILDEQGKYLGAVHVAKDISDIKQMENMLREKIEVLENFKQTTVDREIRVIELKKEVNRLSEEIGRQPPYNVSFLE
jgi:two-component system, sensor histidine kinase and response regulator